jgi:hypothetical protein
MNKSIVFTSLIATSLCFASFKKTDSKPVANNEITTPVVENTKIQVVLLLDTSSMDGLIEQAKSRLSDIVNGSSH